MKKTLIVGNWKMNLTVHQASLLVHRLNAHIKTHRDIEVVLAPGFIALQPLSLEIDHRKFKLAAQNAHYKDEGAYTGEVSFTQLHDLVDYVIVGHSERRIYFNESLDTVCSKVAAAVRNNITPILCIGETKQERLDGYTKRVIHDQLTTAIANLTIDEVENIVIAYEPVWAISTFGGEVAKPSDIEQVIKYIRHNISELYNAQVAENIRVIYGGSVDDHTAAGFLSIPGCDGALPGSASLNYQKFSGIIDAAYRIKHTDG